MERTQKKEMRTNSPELIVQETDSKMILEGYAAVFEDETDLTYFTEEIARGAFTSALERGDDVAALFNHNQDLILARTPKTLHLTQDEKGLKVRIELPNTSYSRDLYEHVKVGNISQMSFAFYILRESVISPSETNQRTKPHFIIEDVQLIDVSPVTYPAYPTTEIGIGRSSQDLEKELSERMKRVKTQSETGPATAQIENENRQRKIQMLKLLIG